MLFSRASIPFVLFFKLIILQRSKKVLLKGCGVISGTASYITHSDDFNYLFLNYCTYCHYSLDWLDNVIFIQSVFNF